MFLAKYVNGSSTITNLLILSWKNGKEWAWYSSKYLPEAFTGISTNNLILLEVATACTTAILTLILPYGNGMVLHFYQQQESSTNKTVHKVINKGLKAYV